MQTEEVWAFEWPGANNVDGRLNDVDGRLVACVVGDWARDRLQTALARVLLREGVAAEALEVSTSGWVDWNDHAMIDIRIRAIPEEIVDLEFHVDAIEFDYDAYRPEEGVWVRPLRAWTEFIDSHTGIDLKNMRFLTAINFENYLQSRVDTTLGEGVLGADARFDPDALSEDEQEIVEILAETFADVDLAPEPLYTQLQNSESEDYEAVICAWLKEACREFSEADADGLIKMNDSWGDVPLSLQIAPVRSVISVEPADDPMVWKGLPEGRQREVLEAVPEWLRLLAVVVPGTTEGALRWLASVATPRVSKVLNASPNVSDEIKALAALSS